MIIEVNATLDGHPAFRWFGIMDAAGQAELQRKWDEFMRGDEKTLEDCKAKFANPFAFKAPVCNYPGVIDP